MALTSAGNLRRCNGPDTPIGIPSNAPPGAGATGLLRPDHAVPIHYDDDTVFKSPLSDFRRAVDDAGLATEVHSLDRGDHWRFGIPVADAPIE